MKRILITGGSGGIGRATVQRLLDLGYAVVNLDVTPWEAGHPNYHFVKVDIGQQSDLDQVLADLPYIDGLINNAVLSNNGPFLSQSMKELTNALDVNIVAPVRLSQWFANQYDGNTGRIVNISSTRARMSEADTIPYTLSKGAIEALTHSLAITLAPKRITVNAIAPGWIHHSGPKPSASDQTFHPSGRVGRPDDIARTIAFLLDEASQFITGEIITIDGGVTKKMIYPE